MSADFCLRCDPPVEGLDSDPEFPDLSWTYPYLDKLSEKLGLVQLGKYVFDEEDEADDWLDAEVAIRDIDSLVDRLVGMKDREFCKEYPDARVKAVRDLAGMRWYLQEACRNNRKIQFMYFS
ncbi:hypothetical protein [Novipirellula caenicola]|uniref:DUF1877 family protein n=1 Tax=Novipirellula caenicola TaxID=1536901 RepID=A0ABP9VXI2_9BACT